MSGTGTPVPPDDDRLVVAGEYVLGTLPGDERDLVAAECGRDPMLFDAVSWWERRLEPLLAAVSPVDPPAAVWPRVERTLADASAGVPPVAAPSGPTPSGPAAVPRVVLVRGVAFWRNAAGAAFLLAACVSALALFTGPRPGAPAPSPAVVAALSPLGGAPAAFVVQREPDGALRVLPLHPAAVPAGRDLELWSLAAGSTVPVPLGVLPAAGARIAADRLPAAAARILVSLEPAGGSPTGAPTGPVLYGGSLSPPAG